MAIPTLPAMDLMQVVDFISLSRLFSSLLTWFEGSFIQTRLVFLDPLLAAFPDITTGIVGWIAKIPYTRQPGVAEECWGVDPIRDPG
jgi:hypothetical protein